PVLDVRPDDPGGRFGPERPGLGLLGPRCEPEELLLDDVGDFADPALEDVGQLEERRLDALIAVARGQVGREAFETAPRRRVGRKQVAGTPRGAKGRHRMESRSATTSRATAADAMVRADERDGDRQVASVEPRGSHVDIPYLLPGTTKPAITIV